MKGNSIVAFDNGKLILGDCLEVMNSINEKVDLIITSPPYEDFTGAGYGAYSKDVLFLKLYYDFLDKVFCGYNNLLKETGQIFFNIKSKIHKQNLKTPHWIEFLESFNLFKLKSYIIWKYAGSFDSSNKRFHLDYEIIYHLSKTDDIYLNTDCGINDPLSSVWYIPHNINNNDRYHPTQMPKGVVERIIKIASKENDLILDSFGGVFTTCIVANELNRRFIGIEMNPENFQLGVKRFEKHLGLFRGNNE